VTLCIFEQLKFFKASSRPALKSVIFDCCVQLILGGFLGGGGGFGAGVICKNPHFDVTGALIRIPLPQRVAE
jgi:hypothetical protein